MSHTLTLTLIELYGPLARNLTATLFSESSTIIAKHFSVLLLSIGLPMSLGKGKEQTAQKLFSFVVAKKVKLYLSVRQVVALITSSPT